jgi:hypothetical protein
MSNRNNGFNGSRRRAGEALKSGISAKMSKVDVNTGGKSLSIITCIYSLIFSRWFQRHQSEDGKGMDSN